jgi:hypothetical protein
VYFIGMPALVKRVFSYVSAEINVTTQLIVKSVVNGFKIAIRVRLFLAIPGVDRFSQKPEKLGVAVFRVRADYVRLGKVCIVNRIRVNWSIDINDQPASFAVIWS